MTPVLRMTGFKIAASGRGEQSRQRPCRESVLQRQRRLLCDRRCAEFAGSGFGQLQGALRLQLQPQQPLGGWRRAVSRRRQVVRALRDSHSRYYKAAPLTAWSPMRSLQSLGKFFMITGLATSTAWYSHPHLLNLAAHVLHLDFKDSVTAFQTSFFSFLSLVFAIYSGNTMAFLYDRQKEMVKNLYNECMALEELLEEAVHALGPDARDILAQIRLYIDTEIYIPENQSPPLGEGFALSVIRAKARNYRRAGTDVGEILQASQRLAHAQSERQATACRLLPPVHWALLYTIGSLFVSTFILFETGGSFSNEGRHILFTVLCGLMSFVLCALRDLADPAEGVYNATALLETRLSYIKVMLDKYQKLPNNRATAAIPGAVAHVSLAASEEVSGPNLLNSVVTAIKTVAGVEEIDAAEEQSPSQVQEPSSTKTKDGSGQADSQVGAKTRPVLEAPLQLNESAPRPAGIAASLGGIRQGVGNAPLSKGGPPVLQGLPPNAQQSNVTRLTGVTSGIVSRPKQPSAEIQFRQQLGSRALLREPVFKAETKADTASVATIERPPAKAQPRGN